MTSDFEYVEDQLLFLRSLSTKHKSELPDTDISMRAPAWDRLSAERYLRFASRIALKTALDISAATRNPGTQAKQSVVETERHPLKFEQDIAVELNSNRHVRWCVNGVMVGDMHRIQRYGEWQHCV
jgi:hypothetical protein